MLLSKKENLKLCLDNHKCYPFLVSDIKLVVWSYRLLPGKGFWTFNIASLIRGILDPACALDWSSERKYTDMVVSS